MKPPVNSFEPAIDSPLSLIPFRDEQLKTKEELNINYKDKSVVLINVAGLSQQTILSRSLKHIQFIQKRSQTYTHFYPQRKIIDSLKLLGFETLTYIGENQAKPPLFNQFVEFDNSPSDAMKMKALEEMLSQNNKKSFYFVDLSMMKAPFKDGEHYLSPFQALAQIDKLFYFIYNDLLLKFQTKAHFIFTSDQLGSSRLSVGNYSRINGSLYLFFPKKSKLEKCFTTSFDFINNEIVTPNCSIAQKRTGINRYIFSNENKLFMCLSNRKEKCEVFK